MAKNKKKSGKLPKEIAGVKIPKGLRTTGDKLVDALRHPLIADIASTVLLAAAAALRDSGDVKKTARQAKAKAGTAAGEVAKGAASLGSTLGVTPAPRKAAKSGGKTKKKK